jgi:(p)ppGpp synthase/HD superfamily hydrolase
MNEISIEYWIRRAREIATFAHMDQTRNNGRPYIKHPERVTAAVEDRLKPIALLHDTVEDSSITLEDLKDEGFPSYILDAVDLLTHRKGESNVSYWSKIKENPDALAVKLEDIHDNVNDHPSEHAKQKYAQALSFFDAH